MTIPPNDTELCRLREDGSEGLADVLNTYASRLKRTISLRLDPRLAGRVDSGDVVQEVYLDARKRLDRYLADPSVPVFVWLRSVTVDTLINVHRRHHAQKRDAALEMSLNSNLTSQSSVSLASRLVDDMSTPSTVAMRQEMTNCIAGILTAMNDIDREVLILRHFEELTNDEVAAIVGVKKAAASRRYMRALLRFRDAIQRSGFDWQV